MVLLIVLHKRIGVKISGGKEIKKKFYPGLMEVYRGIVNSWASRKYILERRKLPRPWRIHLC